MAKLSEQHYEKLKLDDEMGELYLRYLKKFERAEKMNKDESAACSGKDVGTLLKEFRCELEELHKKGI